VKLGILGGTFDPVHLGHLIIAEKAMTSLGLDRVLFVPAGDPWLKAGMEITPRQHRLAMMLAAVADNPKLKVSPSELERFGPSYTVETLAEFQEDYGLQTALYFIIGADALRDFGRWHEPQRVLELCTLAVVGRPAQASLDLPELEAILPGIGQRVALVDDVDIDISATDIRQRVAEGRSIKSLVPPAVEAYIQEQHLYKEKR
jgi:nicotinate-nucleotide adenylyltransferase